MSFCIHCGTQHRVGAIFCSACGQTLYHDPPGLASTKNASFKRVWVWVGCACLAGIIVFSSLATKLPSQPQTHSAESVLPRRMTPQGDGAVLTIVATNETGTAMSQGSGFILSEDGLAVSNYHVVRGTVLAVAKCCNGRVFDIGEVVGADLDRDLIVFQLYETGKTVKPRGLNHLTLVPSTKSVTIGERVIAIGSPEGLENSISDGIVAAVREYNSAKYIQITAPISPGSSGGPVLNNDGQVVGIATFQFKAGQNLNFAIAADHIRPLVGQNLHLSFAEFQSAVPQPPQMDNSSVARQEAPPPTGGERVRNLPLTGRFGGIVHNTSAGLSAEFGLIIDESEGGLLSGCMVVKPPLFGSGGLSGTSHNSAVSFSVTSAIGTIEFEGKRNTTGISGSYAVRHSDRAEEAGTFTLSRLKDEGLGPSFDTARCPTDAEVNRVK
jgi:S1-C subfamily serine protease